MTAVKYPSIGQGQWDLLREVLDSGKLNVRVSAIWMGGRTVESARQIRDRLLALPRPPQSLGDARLLSAGVKLYMDGSGGARTGWMHQDWNKDYNGTDTGNPGYPTTDPEVFRRQVRLLHNAGIHVSTHAVGDRAIDWVVDTYAEALKARPTKGLRHGIIHCNCPTDHALDLMASLQKQYDAALRSYTIWAARQLFLENRIGSIEKGKDADLAVWDRDPYQLPTADLKNLKCELTMVAGRIVYQSAEAAAIFR